MQDPISTANSAAHRRQHRSQRSAPGFIAGALFAAGTALLAWASVGALPGARAGTLLPKVAAPAGGFPFGEYDALLKKYTDGEGRVDYEGLKAGDAATVERLYAVLAATGPDVTPQLYPGRAAALAYYLSAYNLLVWKNVIENMPKLKQVDGGSYSFFRSTEFKVNGKEVTLDDLEKKIIRPLFKDGRVHFALNCASGGCPKLPREAFAPDRIEAQLDREAQRFCSETRNVSFDAAKGVVTLSMIFKWYKEDFAKDDKGLIEYINRYRDIKHEIPVQAKIEYINYDWRMNSKNLSLR